MTKAKAIVLGVFTVLPIAYCVVFIGYFINIFSDIINDSIINEENMVILIVVLHISIMILSIVLMIIYIKDVFYNTSIESDKRVLWAVVLFFGNAIAMPIYWFLKIWKPITKKEIE